MRYNVLFTDTATADLREIALYVAEKSCSIDIAVRFVNELEHECVKLADFPLMGACPKDRFLATTGYRFLVHKDYLICYTIFDEKLTVYVEAIFNAKKDYARVLKKLL